MATVPAVRETERAEPDSTRRRDLVRPARRALDRLLLLGATGTALLMLGGLTISLVSIFALRHPYAGWSDLVVADAKAVATGHFQYGNPVTQPVAAGYTPLFTSVFALLLRVYWWEGWGAVISMLAVAAGAAAIARMGWSAIGKFETRLATASFVVIVVLGGMSAFAPNGVYEARPDQLAWVFFVIASAITFRALVLSAGLSWRQRCAVGLLLSASVLTKQPTLVPCLFTAGLTLAVPPTEDSALTAGFRRWLGLAAAPLVFIGSAAFVGVCLQIASHGFAADFLLRQAFHQPRYIALHQEIKWSLRRGAIPLCAFAVVALCAAFSLALHRKGRPRQPLFVAAAAVGFAVCPIPTSILAAVKMGGNFNQLIGPVWTLTLGATVLLMLMQPSGRQLVASGIACCVLLVGLGVLPRSLLQDAIGKPALDQRNRWVSMNPFLYSAVDQGKVVYDPATPSLSVSERATDYPAGDWVDRFAVGYTPRYFIRNLLEGRYALVAPMPLDSVNTTYWSGIGRYDASIAWKIDLLLSRAYEPVRDPTTGGYYYAPGPQLSTYGWFAQCFGPWEARDAGVAVRVRGAGGLVCAERDGLRLSEAPALSTRLVLTMRAGQGETRVHFAGRPTILQLTPLDGHDDVTAAQSGAAVASVVDRCLAVDRKGARSLTLRAVRGDGAWSCRMADPGPVLEIPVAHGSASHVAIDLAATDAPTLTASAGAGRTVPFVIANTKPY
jgi:hypothetical protein